MIRLPPDPKAGKTVKVHRSRMMKKMGVRSLAELVRITNRFSLGEGP